MIDRLRTGSLIASGLALAIGCGIGGRWLWGIACLSMIFLGWIWRKRLTGEFSTWVFGFLVAMAAFGILAELPTSVMLVGVTTALVYWDLDSFQGRIKQVGAHGAIQQLEKDHLIRLAWVSGIGLVTGLATLLVNFKLSFGLAIILGLLVVFGIRLGISMLNNHQE